MGHLSDIRVIDPVLTSIARGYQNSEFIASKLFPFVQMEKEAGKIPVFGKETFRVYNTERAIRAESNRMQGLGVSTISYATTEHDLEHALDYRELKESLLDLQQMATNAVMEGIRLKHEKMAADIAQDDSLYPSDNKITLTTNQFNDAGSDPIKIIDDGKSALREIIGKRPNTMVMGPKVFEAIKEHTDILEKIKYTALGVVTLDLLKAVFNIPNIFVGEGLYTEDGTSFEDIWKDNIILAYVTNPSGIAKTPYEPCFGYTLQVKGHPVVDTRQDLGGKLNIVRATDNFDIKVVGIESAYLIKDVLQ